MRQIPDNLGECRVAIVGLGLMGGSLAMALSGQCRQLLAIEPDLATRQLAIEKHIVHRIADDPQLLSEADLIVLAAPVKAILSILQELPAYQPGPAMVIDLGSTKKAILTAMQTLPERFEVIGGHPMCGKEANSLVHADSSLFYNTSFALTPLPRSTLRVRQLACEMVAALGAQPLWIDAQTHDQWVAATSHLPYLLANTLSAIIPEEALALAGPGLRSTSRLAGSSLTMMMDILETNREAILLHLGVFKDQFDRIAQYLQESDWAALKSQLAQGKSAYQNLVESPRERAQ